MKLVFPEAKYLPSYEEALMEYQANGLTGFHFLKYDRNHFLERIQNLRTGVNLPNGYVPATYLWLIENDAFAGEISIRHSLTDALLLYGGNIGYWVRCTHWNRGIGTKMLAMAIEYARNEIGLTKALITCDDDNIGSARVIEKNGGILENKLTNLIDGQQVLTRRYWISFAHEQSQKDA